MSSILVPLALVLIFIGIFGVVASLLAFRSGSRSESVRLDKRLGGYEAARAAASTSRPAADATALGTTTLTRKTVGMADRVVTERGFDEQLATSLAAASVNLRPGEWLVLHIGSTLGIGLVLLLLSGISLVAGMLGLAVGFAIPYCYLAVKRSRRRKAFYTALPDMLQMLAGSLSAGYSLPQAFDAVVKESEGPMADELGRALMEVRLGAELEESLEAVATRMESADLSWVVMAIRVQRDVGGNLAEVLRTVGDTLRERERLRRQVSVLSAEGRLSGVILGGLPIVFAIYLALVRPEYLNLLVTTPLGLLMLIIGGLLYIAGIFWMRKVVKVEV